MPPSHPRSPRLAVGLAILALLVPALPRAAVAEATPDPLAKIPSRFVESDGLRVHYRSQGKGKEAVVYVHGWLCDMTFWRDQVPAFEGKVRQILVDLPGHGQSAKPAIAYTMDLFAASLDAVLKDAGVKKAVLVGHSMGTPVVRQFYRRHPEKTLGLVAVDGSFRPFFTDPNQSAAFVGRFEGPEWRKNVEAMVDSMFPGGTSPEVHRFVKPVMTSAPQQVAAGAVRGMIDPAIWGEDPIRVPVQAIMAKSPFWTSEYEAYVRKLAPDLDYRVMDGVTHFLMLDRPAEFNAILGEFLRKRRLLEE